MNGSDNIYLRESIILALEGIASNKIRAFLTILSIVSGILSVITNSTLVDAMYNRISNSISRLGVTNIQVTLQNKNSSDLSPVGGNLTESDLISDEMVRQYRERFKNRVTAVSLSNIRGAGEARGDTSYAKVSFMGVNEDYAAVNDLEILEGRFIRESDLSSERYVAVVSDKLVSNMFMPGQDYLGTELKAEMAEGVQIFTIIGVYKYETPLLSNVAESDRDLQTYLFMPLTTINRITSSEKGYVNIIVQAKDRTDVSDLTVETRDFFNIFYENNSKYDVTAGSLYERWLSVYSDNLDLISLAGTIISTLALIAGGIGVMNIMYVTVAERKREIGMRKAIGARDISIQIQFIVEAVIISGLGGLLGSIAGFFLGYGLSILLTKNPTLPSVSIIITAVLFSMLIGVFFGYYPANKAAKLDPVEALRYE